MKYKLNSDGRMKNVIKNELQIETISDNREDVFSSLLVLQDVFNDDHFDYNFWKWKYKGNPFGKSILIHGWVKQKGVVIKKSVCFRAFWRWRFWSKGKYISAAQPCDTAVIKDYRRMGLFKQMNVLALEKAKENGIEILFNNPNPEAKIGYIKMNWKEISSFRWNVKILKKNKTIFLMLKKNFRLGDCEYREPAMSGYYLLDFQKINQLFFRCKQAHKDIIWTARNSDFIKWRYQKSPLRKYNIVAWPLEGDYKVFIVYGMGIRNGLKEMQILDILIDPEESSIAIKSALKSPISIEKPDWITFAATQAFPYLKKLREIGFIPIPKSIPLVARLVKFPDRANLKLSKIAIVLGDIDTF